MKNLLLIKRSIFTFGFLFLLCLSFLGVLLLLKNPRTWDEVVGLWKLEEMRKAEGEKYLELAERYYAAGKGTLFEFDDEAKIQMSLDYAEKGLKIPDLPQEIRDRLLELKLRCKKEL